MKKLLLSILFFASITHSNNITVFAHGIVDNACQSQRFEKAIATTQVVAPNFADALNPAGYNFNNMLHTICSYFGKKVNRNAMFMGQTEDINVIKRTIDDINPDDKIILYGCSRGGAAAVSYLGIHNPKNIAALVVDGCPANMPETIQMALARLGINPTHCNSIFSYIFPQYDPKTAIPPLEAIQTIKNKNLPILLIHSLEDKSVHYTNSLKLYQAFIDAGFKNVHLCLLPNGRHSFLLQDQRVEHHYASVVHAFYKEYNLPHNQQLSNDVFFTYKFDFDRFDLVTILNNIPGEIEKYQQEILQTYAQSYQKNIYYSVTAIAIAITYWYLKNNL